MVKREIVLGIAALLMAAATASAQVPNEKARIEQLARDNPNTFNCAHTPAACGRNFVKLVACKLNPEPSLGRWGLNGKRGNPKDLSYDALNWKGDGPGQDSFDPQNNPVTVVDFIQGAGASGASVSWTVFTDPVASSGAWVRPTCKGDVPADEVAPPIVCPVCPPPPVKPSYPGDVHGRTLGDVLWADYLEAGQSPNTGMGVWFWRTAWDAAIEGLTTEASIKKHRNEWRILLGLAPVP